MGTHELTLDTDISATPHHVWGIIADAAHYPNWMSKVDRTEGHMKLKLGATFSIHSRLGSRHLTAEVKVVDFEPEKRLEWHHEKNILDGEVTDMMSDGRTGFMLKPSGKGTHLTARISFVPHGLRAKLGAGLFLNTMIKPQMEASLERFKTLCEKK